MINSIGIRKLRRTFFIFFMLTGRDQTALRSFPVFLLKDAMKNNKILKIGVILKDFRSESKMSQDDMAKLLKTTQANYSKVENGIQKIGPTSLLTLIKYLRSNNKNKYLNLIYSMNV